MNIVYRNPFGDDASAAIPGTWLHCREWLEIGPSDIDPERHKAKRREFWDHFPQNRKRRNQVARAGGYLWYSTSLGDSADLATLVASEFTHPVVLRLWCTRNWSDRLFLWWLLEVVNRAKLSVSAILLCDVSEEFFDIPLLLGYTENATELSDSAKSTGVEMWSCFATGRPDRLSNLGGGATAADAAALGLKEFMTTYARLFPRYHRGHLRLSAFDETLLNHLHTDSWQRPLDLAEFLFEDIDRFGDIVPVDRLFRWSEHHADCLAVERKGQ